MISFSGSYKDRVKFEFPPAEIGEDRVNPDPVLTTDPLLLKPVALISTTVMLKGFLF